ncbi:MAG: glycosyltransferase [Candidatus Paceibacterota bacterium]|jgi:glycosyltransferase involved in cell wall biosynthesis
MAEKKTKIFYLITKGNFGGAQRYVYELASSLPTADFEVAVILGEGEILAKKLNEKNIRVIYLPELGRDINLGSDWAVFWSLYGIFRREQPDVIHLNSSKIGGLGSLAGRLAGIKKIIFTGHGWAFNEKRSWLQKKAISFLSWLTIMFSHQTVLVSKSLMKQISTWPLTAGKLKLIYNGIDFINFLAERDARTLLLPNKADKFWIGTIAELHPNKGLDILIEAFARLVKDMLGSQTGWSLYLVIIGEGQERAKLEKMISDKRLDGRIILLGQVDDARKYLHAFDIFVLPSRTEAFPYALLEAGSAGVPIIASEVGGVPEIIPDAEYGLLVPPENIHELEKSLKYMIIKDHYRALTSKNIQKYIRDNFSMKKMVEETIHLYQK